MSSWHVAANWTDSLKGHVSLCPAEIPPFVFSNELTITLPLMFTQRYWAILKLDCLKNTTHTELNAHLHTFTHEMSTQVNMRKNRLAHMYDPLKRSSASGSDKLLLNRSITFSPNDNDIIRPFICGVIHVDSNPLCSFPAIAFLSDSCPAL